MKLMVNSKETSAEYQKKLKLSHLAITIQKQDVNSFDKTGCWLVY